MKSKISFLALFILLASSVASANPPNKIDASYDEAKHELGVQVEHSSSNRKKHFIKEVIIYRNGEEVRRLSFDFQTSLRNQTMPPIKIDAKAGDELKIVAICNKSGRGEKSVIVGK